MTYGFFSSEASDGYKGPVRGLPRAGLWLTCLAYVLAGFLGRSPWKTADANAFGVMQEMVLGLTDWLQIQSLTGSYDGLLPMWLGATAIRLLPFIAADQASRLPFMPGAYTHLTMSTNSRV